METSMTQSFSLRGRTAFVTGSSRGIGRAIAFALARAGASVLFHGSRESDALRSAVEEARAFFGEGEDTPAIAAVTADLGDDTALCGLPSAIAALGFSSPDILVLNASHQTYATIEDYTPELFDRHFHTNVGAACRLIGLFAPAMKKRHWGRIVGIGSVNQMRPASRLAIYASTKAALDNLLLGAAKAYAADGITVNDIVPGVIYTDRNHAALSNEDFRANVISQIPAGRLGTPEDMAGIAVALCSDACSYVTGASIPVSGGFHL